MSHAHEPPPPIRLLQMMMGHWIGQVTATLASLGVPEKLAEGARKSDDVAAAVGADPDALYRLMRAGAAAGLLVQDGRSFALTPVGECLRAGAPGSMRDLILAELAPGHWLPWGRLEEAVRTGKPVARAALGMEVWDYYAKNADEGQCFARGMSNLSAMAAAETLPEYDFSRFERIVDVGGSHGMVIASALRAAPNAHGVLFDRPDVLGNSAARDAIAAHGLGARLECVAGDFFAEVPAGGDLYVLKSVLHDWPDKESIHILRTVHRGARPGAKVLVIELVIPPTPGPSPVPFMDMNMLVMLGGRERTPDEFGALLGEGGWKLDRVIPTKGLFVLLEATRVG